MTQPEEDPNLKFLTELGVELHRSTEVQRLVMQAMSQACRITASGKDDKNKAVSLGATVREITTEILDLF